MMCAGGAATGYSLAILGAIESIYHSAGDLAPLIYGFGLNGVGGAILGFVLAMLFGGRHRTDRQIFLRFTCLLAIIPSVVFIMIAGTILIYRDLWQESVSQSGFLGWLALLLVLVSAVAYSFIAYSIGHLVANKAKGACLSIILIGILGTAFASSSDQDWSIPKSRLESQAENQLAPPVIFVVVDSLRADMVGSDLTPGLNAFSKDAVSYTQAWAASSSTLPSMVSILTGRYPAAHGIFHNSNKLPQKMPTLASLLKNHGYLAVASVSVENPGPTSKLDLGFDVWAQFTPRPFLAAPPTAARLFFVELYRWLKLHYFPGYRDVEHYYAPGELVLDQANRFISTLSASKRSFFAYFHFMEPNSPYFEHPYNGNALARVENQEPSSANSTEYLALYKQDIVHFDGLFAGLISSLKNKGIYDRAIIVLASDHGQEFGDHGHFWHGSSLYQEQIQVPLFIRYPKGVGSDLKYEWPVSLVDLVPTILKQVGLDTEFEFDGKDISLPQQTFERAIYAQEEIHGYLLSAIRIRSNKLIRANPSNSRGLKEVELYNLDADPKELEDLSSKQSTLAKEMLQLLDANTTK
jgi:arylsulfatase A-like enzyme